MNLSLSRFLMTSKMTTATLGCLSGALQPIKYIVFSPLGLRKALYSVKSWLTVKMSLFHIFRSHDCWAEKGKKITSTKCSFPPTGDISIEKLQSGVFVLLIHCSRFANSILFWSTCVPNAMVNLGWKPFMSFRSDWSTTSSIDWFFLLISIAYNANNNLFVHIAFFFINSTKKRDNCSPTSRWLK